MRIGTRQVEEEQNEDGLAFQYPLADCIWEDLAYTRNHFEPERLGLLEALALEVLAGAQDRSLFVAKRS